MSKEWFEDHNFRADTMATIEQANIIINEYADMGFSMTLRQLHYQLVARGLMENTFRKYKRLGKIMRDARMAGLVDWAAIEDRTRSLQKRSHWKNEKAMMYSAYKWFGIDLWRDQPNRIEVWIEKEALAGVIEPTCQELDVSFFSCRGYASLSELHKAGKRLARYNDLGQNIYILHLGDHDPSGIDMTRNIIDQVNTLAERMVSVDRLALNWEQIELYNPPPYFTKLTDSRAGGYVSEYGNDSWELDALRPDVIAELIENAVIELRDEQLWQDAVEQQKFMKNNLGWIYKNWELVEEFLEENGEWIDDEEE